MRIVSIFSYVYFFAWIFLSFLPYIYYSTKAYVVLLTFLSISAVGYTFHLIGNYKLIPFFKCLFVFVGFLSIYGLWHWIAGERMFWVGGDFFVEKNRYLMWLSISMLSVVPVYVFTCRGDLNEFRMKILFLFMFAASILAFHVTYQQMLLEATILGIKQEEFTITVVYFFLSILPLIFLFKKRVFWQFILLFIFFIFFIMSAKRGVILLGSICIMFMIWGILSNFSVKKKTLFFFLSLFFLVGLFKFTMIQMENSSYLMMRYEDTLEGNTSQRDVFIAVILDYIDKNFSIKNFFFGIGAQETLSVNYSFAHNDWIAILLEQGLLGLLSYLIFWIGFIYTWLKSWKYKNSFVVIGSLVIIGFGKTMFSMFYLPVVEGMIISSGFYSIVLGYYLGITFPQYSSDEIRALNACK